MSSVVIVNKARFAASRAADFAGNKFEKVNEVELVRGRVTLVDGTYQTVADCAERSGTKAGSIDGVLLVGTWGGPRAG